MLISAIEDVEAVGPCPSLLVPVSQGSGGVTS